MVPTRAELPAYEARVGGLLGKTATSETRAKLAPSHERVYRHLVPTTALIESCWRQYVVRGGKVSYLRSQAASVGIMQINQRVWRGFYDMERVRWDTAYNIRAGAQILLRYLKDYAVPFAERTGDPEHVARAAYAVYNGGPRAVGRFTKSPPHPREARRRRAVDALPRHRGRRRRGSRELQREGSRTTHRRAAISACASRRVAGRRNPHR